MPKVASRIRKVKLDEIVVDRRVQRGELDERRVQEIAEEFSWEAFGVPCLSDRTDSDHAREDGEVVVLDGWHRIEAAKLAGYGEYEKNCEVFTGLDLPTEASIFRMRNNTKTVQYLDKYRVRLVEGDDVALGIQKLLREYGWGIPENKDELHPWFALRTLESLFKRSSDLAERTIAVVTKSWNYEAGSADNRVVGGMGAFLHRYGSRIDTTNLVKRLQMYSGGPGHMIGKAQGIRAIYGGKMSYAIAEVITNDYNKYKQAHRLPQWRTATPEE